MPRRIIIPELLDHLPHGDPEALRSRKDLRRINTLMGNERWILREIRRLPAQAAHGIVELGAGDGHLISRVSRLFPEIPLAACDLAPRPAHLAESIHWRQGDILDHAGEIHGGILLANLFIHHFDEDTLARIGRICDRFDAVLFCEPDRAPFLHLHARVLHPFINRVTRHDMHASIDAGFAAGEIPAMLRLQPDKWTIAEHSTWRGARRVLALRL